MRLQTAVYSMAMMISMSSGSLAYSTNGRFDCRPPNRGMSGDPWSKPRQVKFQKQADFVNRAFADLANELIKDKQEKQQQQRQEEEDRRRNFKERMENQDSSGSARTQTSFFDSDFFDMLSSEMGLEKEEAAKWRELANKSANIFQNFMSVSYTPPYDIDETDTVLNISLDLPGVNKDDIDIELEDLTLSISGNREFGTDEDKTTKSVPFSASFRLDDNLETDKMSAAFNNGVLLVTVPKKTQEEEKTSKKKIHIN